MAFSYTNTIVQHIVNGTALIDVAPSVVGGGVPQASGFLSLGVGGPDGVKLHRVSHQSPVFDDHRGPSVPAQVLINGVTGFLTLDLTEYDQGILMQFVEQGSASLNSSSNPTGFGVNVGVLMFDNLQLQNNATNTSCVHIRAPGNLFTQDDTATQHDWYFPRAWIADDSEFDFSTQLLVVPLRIAFAPDASGYAYYRTPINAYSQSATDYQNIVTIQVDQYNLVE